MGRVGVFGPAVDFALRLYYRVSAKFAYVDWIAEPVAQAACRRF